MIKVTLDSNCVFVLDEKDPKTAFMQQFVRQLINLHKQRKIEIQIPSIMAYENRLGEKHGIPLDKYKDSWRNLERELRQKIKGHGFEPCYLPRLAIMPEPELYPSSNLFPAGKDIIALFEEIKDIIHPKIDFDRMLEEAQKKDSEVVFGCHPECCVTVCCKKVWKQGPVISLGNFSSHNNWDDILFIKLML